MSDVEPNIWINDILGHKEIEERDKTLYYGIITLPKVFCNSLNLKIGHGGQEELINFYDATVVWPLSSITILLASNIAQSGRFTLELDCLQSIQQRKWTIQYLLATFPNTDLTVAIVQINSSLFAVEDGCLLHSQFPVSFLALYSS